MLGAWLNPVAPVARARVAVDGVVVEGAASVDDALAALRHGEVHAYVGRFAGDRTALYWQEDEHFAADGDEPAVRDDEADAQGPRHRLMMDRLPWVYLNSF